MSIDADALIRHYREQVRKCIEGRPWLVGMNVAVAATRTAQQLLDLGAENVLAVAATRGVGDLPDPDVVRCLLLGLESEADMLDAIRRSLDALTHLPAWVLDEIDRFDPDGKARVLETPFGNGKPLAGRPVYGARRPEWQALEDKMIIDAVWDAAGIERAPSAILPVEFDGLWAAHQQLDCGMGTVWVGDNREGWHGGAKMLRWVRSRSEGRAAQLFLAEHCDRVRVMPFLEGIPCSIHGWVFPREVISIRPCEMLVLRRKGSDRLVYAGAATTWEPSDTVRIQMESAVVRVGEHIRKKVGYRGSFTMDGVVTADGFLPTELNPRFGGALSRMSRGIPDLPLYMIHLATMAGEELDYRPEQLQALVRQQAAAHPVVRGMYMMEGVEGLPERRQPLCRFADGWRLAENEEPADAHVAMGPANAGTIIMVSLEEQSIVRGPSVAPDICDLLNFVNDRWGLEIETLLPAPDIRTM